MRSRAAAGLWPVRGWAADPRVVVGRPEREEGEEGVGEAVEAITEVPLESAPEISGVGRGVGGVEGCAEGCAARAWEVAEEGDGEEREDDEDEEEHEHEITQRGHRQQDLPCDRAGWRGGGGGAGGGGTAPDGSRCLSPEQGCRARVQSRGAEQGRRAGGCMRRRTAWMQCWTALSTNSTRRPRSGLPKRRDGAPRVAASMVMT